MHLLVDKKLQLKTRVVISLYLLNFKMWWKTSLYFVGIDFSQWPSFEFCGHLLLWMTSLEKIYGHKLSRMTSFEKCRGDKLLQKRMNSVKPRKFLPLKVSSFKVIDMVYISFLIGCRVTQDLRKLGNFRKISKLNGIIAECAVFLPL